jgi:hypothetical protein
MSDLSPEIRALLECAKADGEPDDAAVTRVRGALLRKVGGVAIASGALTTTTRAAAALKWLSPMGKVVAGLSMIGAAATGAHVYFEQSQPVVALHQAPLARTSEVPTPSAIPAPLPQEAPVPSVVASASASTRPPTPARPKRTTPPVPPKPSPTQAVPELTRDIEQLRAAQAALVDGDAKRALAAVDNVNPQGPLSEEREGVRALAACLTGAPGTSQMATDFVRRFPDAPLTLRVRAACLDGR